MECVTCGKNHNNPKFCSRSCAAKWTNKHYPKKQKIRFNKNCELCNKEIDYRSKRCINCSGFLGDMTLKEAIYKKHHKSSAFALVRTRARVVAKKLGFTKCIKCGYDKHVEVAHIKPISSFSEEVMISVINSKENIMPLCPNCHWEYDHNLWT
jgi:5-methylcytosine-specific restriction endonuclease McrA